MSGPSPLQRPVRMFARSVGRLLGIGYLLLWSLWCSLRRRRV